MLIIRSRQNAQRKRIHLPLGVAPGRSESAVIVCARMCRSDVAPAPLKLLPDYAEERSIRQGSQWKRFLPFADSNDRSALDVDGSAAVQRQVNWIIGMTRFDFDDRSIRHNDRAVCENVRANRRYDEYPRLRIENRPSG